jgi:hypothetical protein
VRSRPAPASSITAAAQCAREQGHLGVPRLDVEPAADQDGPPGAGGRNDLLLGQLQLDRAAAHGERPAQPAHVGQRLQRRVGRPAGVEVGLHGDVVEPRERADHRAPHVDRGRLAAAVEVDAPEHRGARTVGQEAGGILGEHGRCSGTAPSGR